MQTVRVEFTNALGDQYVEMRTLKAISWRLAKKFQTIKGVSTNGDKITFDDEAAVELAEMLALELVVGGKVYDAYGNEMTFPLTTETIGNAPVELLRAVVSKFAEMQQAQEDETKKS